MIIDAHVYCLPQKLRAPEAVLPQSENMIADAIYKHPEGCYALNLSSPESIKSSMDENKIDKSVLVAFPWSDQDLCIENNNFILETVLKHSCFMAVCAVQPNGKVWNKEVERVLNNGAIGIKINPAWQGFELDGSEMDELADFIEQKKAFLMVHVDQPFRKSPASPAHLFNLAQRHPKTKILAAHMGGLLGLCTLHSPVADVLKNVWFDTAVSSTLGMVNCYVDAGLRDKIIFGTDFPFNHNHSQKQVLEGIRELNLSSNIEKAILYENFYSFINL